MTNLQWRTLNPADGWQIISPPQSEPDGRWRWSASADTGRYSASGVCRTEDEARQRARETCAALRRKCDS